MEALDLDFQIRINHGTHEYATFNSTSTIHGPSLDLQSLDPNQCVWRRGCLYLIRRTARSTNATYVCRYVPRAMLLPLARVDAGLACFVISIIRHYNRESETNLLVKDHWRSPVFHASRL